MKSNQNENQQRADEEVQLSLPFMKDYPPASKKAPAESEAQGGENNGRPD